jgi:XisI protein
MASTVDYKQIVDERFAELERIFKQQSRPDKDGAKTAIVRDFERGCFLIVRFGWRDKHRIRAVTMYVKVEGDQVIVEEDMTDWRLVDRLIENGIPPEHIILAFQEDQPTAADCTVFA